MFNNRLFVAAILLSLLFSHFPVISQKKETRVYHTTVKNGDAFSITLPSSNTTGYSWKLTKNISLIKNNIVRYLDHTYKKSKSALMGASGTEHWNFMAIAKGRTTLSFEYKRTFEANNAPAKIYTISIIIT